MPNPVASINAQLSLDSAQFSTGLGKARQDLKAFGVSLQGLPRSWQTGIVSGAKDVSGAFSGAARDVPVLTSVLNALGPAGVAASVGVGLAAAGFGLLLDKGRAALEFADEIGDSAQKIGVTTDMLQQYRYAISQAGGETKDADAALAAFTVTLGKAASGLAPKAAKGFTALGLDAVVEQAKGVDQALKDVADRVEKLGVAPSAAAVDWLGLTPLLPLLRQGSAEIDRLREAASKLGYVMDADLIAKAGEAQDKVDALQQVIKVQLNSALVDAAPLILSTASAFADVARAIADATAKVGEFQTALNRQKLQNLNRLAEVNAPGKGFWSGTGVEQIDVTLGRMPTFLGGKGGQKGYAAWIQAEIAKTRAALEPPPPRPSAPPPPTGRLAGGGGRSGRGGGGGGSSRPSRTVQQINDELALEAARARGDDAEEQRLKNRLDLQKRIREYEDAGLKPAAAQLAAQNAIQTLKAAQAETTEREVARLGAAAELEAARAAGDTDAVRVLEARAALEEQTAAYQREGLERAPALAKAAADLQRIGEGEAVARERALAADRKQLDLQVAQLTQSLATVNALERERDLQARIDFYLGQKLDKAQAERMAQEDLLRLDRARADAARQWARDDAGRQALELARARGDERSAGRLEREQAIRDRYDELTRNQPGLDPMVAVGQAVGDIDAQSQARLQGVFRATFRDGVQAALDGDFGDFVQNWWKDRLSNALGKNFDGLADAIGGAFSKSSGEGLGGLLSKGIGALFGSWGGAHATGGSFMVGGAGGRDANLVTMALTRGERVDITPAGAIAPAGGGVVVHFAPTFDARGAGPREVDQLKTEMARMQATLPGEITRVAQEGLSRGVIRPGRR